MTSRVLGTPKLWPAHEHHVRHAGWTELFYDLVFAAAISQLSVPLGLEYSLQGVGRYAFLLALVFLAWLGYAKFSTQFAVDDVLQRVLIVAQVFLVAVMAANATGPLSGTDAAGFGAAYGGVRGILALQYLCVVKLEVTRPLVVRRIIGLAMAAIVWTSSAFLPAPYRYFAWTFALLIDLGNSWLPARMTNVLPPGATHFPERFGLLTIILLGEFVASVMRGIESQMGWSVLAASAAVISLALGFALWSSYSDGASGWEVRHVRCTRDVVHLRIWIGLHFLLFLGIGILGVGARRGIALAPGGHFSQVEQWLICFAAAVIVMVIMGIAATSARHKGSGQRAVWLGQGVIVVLVLISAFAPEPPAAVLLFVLFICFVGQTILLVLNQKRQTDLNEV